ncbi:MAG: hypothetical protein ACLR2G_11715 [Phascolarctobacterium faecium]
MVHSAAARKNELVIVSVCQSDTVWARRIWKLSALWKRVYIGRKMGADIVLPAAKNVSVPI